MNLFDPVTLLAVALVVVFIAAGVLAYRLHLAGVPNAQLARQTALKAGGVADELRDRVLAIIAEQSAKAVAAANLRAAYFDQADFTMDVGRLPAAYTKAVLLDGKLVRNGDLPGDEYITDAVTGNVRRA